MDNSSQWMTNSSSLWMDNSTSSWSRHEDKMFESGLARYGEETFDRWEKIAELLPQKTAKDVEQHYQILLADVADIDAGLIEVPNYMDNPGVVSAEKKGKERKQAHQWTAEEHKYSIYICMHLSLICLNCFSFVCGARPLLKLCSFHVVFVDCRRFLEGLNRYGKGDWKSIARQCVKTRSSTQVASHAQKYFIHLEKDAKNRGKKRASIYDVSLED